MLRRRRERGEGQFGCLVGLAVLVIAGLIAYRMIPIKVKAAELRDVVIDESKSAGQHKDAQMKKAILAKAEDLELPVSEEDIVIRRRSSDVSVEVTYTVPVEFPGYTYEWNFRHYNESPIF